MLTTSRTIRSRASRGLLIAAVGLSPHAASGQLTLPAALAAARESSPELRAAREAVAAAGARERQAGAYPNPTLAYGREQTSRAGQTNAQDIAQVEQAIEPGGVRAARRDAARSRREAAEARLAVAQAQLDLDVARAFALAVAADRRARLAEQAAASFVEARRVSDRRLAGGDISGYAARRLRLEAARYAAQSAAAMLERRASTVALASLLGGSAGGADSLTLAPDSAAVPAALPALDTLIAQAERGRAELRVASLEASAAAADARLAGRERTPVPVLTAGYKGERTANASPGTASSFIGFVAGVSVPLPLFDRRAGVVAAAEADARRVAAEGDAVRRRVAREIADAADALRAAEAQRAALAPHVGDETRAALRAIQTAYAEGEATLTEWLDAVRAYQDAESTYATLQADVAVRRAELARAVGVSPLAPNGR